VTRVLIADDQRHVLEALWILLKGEGCSHRPGAVLRRHQRGGRGGEVGPSLADSWQRGCVHPQLRWRDGSRVWAKCAYSHAYTHCNPCSDTKRNADCHTNIYTEASPDSTAPPYAAAFNSKIY